MKAPAEGDWLEVDGCDYSEEEDAYYIPEGWYEWGWEQEESGLIDRTVTHWIPLPQPPEDSHGLG